jgi:hypothetical protein
MTDPNLIVAEAASDPMPAGKPGRRSQADINAELRAKAARQAAKDLTPIPPEELVTCEVTKKGDGRISTGQHVAGIGEVHYEKGETFTAPRATAEALEDRNFVIIR